MNNSINARIAAMYATLDRIKMEQAAPVDPLSRSLWDFGAELAALDDLGMISEAEALEVPVEALQSMKESYTRALCW